jgi:hypothetical protein
MTPDTIYTPSEKIICRDIMGTMVIVPIESGIADLDDAMFSFNETGTLAWKCINPLLINFSWLIQALFL